jgi:hypothetical protein
MTKEKVNDIIQWVGTAFILVMYVISNFFKGTDYDNLRNGVALIGAICFFAWAYRVANKQQMIINGTAMAVCLIGLYKAF